MGANSSVNININKVPKKRSIIVEGADASGKSTLVNKLSEHYKIHAFSAGPKPPNREVSEVCMIYQCAWLKNTSCIWDRFTGISNVCNMPPLPEDEIPAHAYYVKVALESAVVVVCTASNLTMHVPSSYETDENISQMLTENEQVRNNYIKMAHDLPNVIRYDFNVRTFESLIEEIDRAFSVDVQGP